MLVSDIDEHFGAHRSVDVTQTATARNQGKPLNRASRLAASF
jgi:hypothetical protein